MLTPAQVQTQEHATSIVNFNSIRGANAVQHWALNPEPSLCKCNPSMVVRVAQAPKIELAPSIVCIRGNLGKIAERGTGLKFEIL